MRELEQRLKVFTEFAMAHREWEENVLTYGGSWCDEMIEQFKDEFEHVQTLRKRALGV